MSHFAGVMFADRDKPLDDLLCKNIRRVLSRFPNEEIEEFSAPGIYVAKFDIGAIGSAGAYRASDDSFAVLAGDPVLQLDRAGPSLDRSQALPILHEAVENGEPNIFNAARGSFCSAHYYPKIHRLVLLTDSLAVRSLYCYSGNGFQFFATSMRVVEEVDFVPKNLDERGLVELLGFGYSLADRTPYEGVRYLDAAEILSYENGKVNRSHYFQWNSLVPNSIGIEEAIDALAREFEASLRCRLRPEETSVNAFLSGGLDSRLIVTELARQVDIVNTFNSARVNSADRILGRQYAEAIGSQHFEYVHAGDYVHPATAILDAYPENELAHRTQASRPRLIWSGDGGSIGLGFVHLNEFIISYEKNHTFRDAVLEFKKYNSFSISKSVFSSPFFERASKYLLDDFSDYVDSLCTNSCPTSFLLFLLFNDQRRHLVNHFETIDLSRIDLNLPFLDHAILNITVRLPLNEGIYHKFYYKFLEHFPDVTRDIPWQAYPDHLPCPLPLPPEATYQWSVTRKWQRPNIGNMLRGLGGIIPPAKIRSPLLDWWKIFLANVLVRFGFTQYSYIVKPAETVQSHYEKCLTSLRLREAAHTKPH